jgi:hypothetical protein
MKSIICSVLMALTITMANAQQSSFSANSVLPGCKAVFEESRGLGRQDTGYCVGAINALTFLSPTECIEIPDEVTFLQILLAVVGFIEAHPQRMDEPFVELAFEALLEAWPCRPQQPRP